VTLLELDSSEKYRDYYVNTYCRSAIWMKLSDGTEVRIFFDPHQFGHAFFESPSRDGVKASSLSMPRAQRMHLIKQVLGDPSLARKQGWDSKRKRIDPSSCVCVISPTGFVVVVRFSFDRSGKLRGKFVTCYVADNSLGKILDKPNWNRNDCERELSRH